MEYPEVMSNPSNPFTAMASLRYISLLLHRLTCSYQVIKSPLLADWLHASFCWLFDILTCLVRHISPPFYFFVIHFYPHHLISGFIKHHQCHPSSCSRAFQKPSQSSLSTVFVKLQSKIHLSPQRNGVDSPKLRATAFQQFWATKLPRSTVVLS